MRLGLVGVAAVMVDFDVSDTGVAESAGRCCCPEYEPALGHVCVAEPAGEVQPVGEPVQVYSPLTSMQGQNRTNAIMGLSSDPLQTFAVFVQGHDGNADSLQPCDRVMGIVGNPVFTMSPKGTGDFRVTPLGTVLAFRDGRDTPLGLYVPAEPNEIPDSFYQGSEIGPEFCARGSWKVRTTRGTPLLRKEYAAHGWRPQRGMGLDCFQRLDCAEPIRPCADGYRAFSRAGNFGACTRVGMQVRAAFGGKSVCPWGHYHARRASRALQYCVCDGACP